MILQANSLTKEYSRNNHTFNAIENIDLSLEKGEFVSIIGHSGSGKSTLLNILSGILSPTNGNLIINNKNIFQLTPQKMAEFRNQEISYILQGDSLLENFNVLDNVCMPSYLSKTKAFPQETAIYTLTKLGLEKSIHEYPKNLSGGEKRRVSIARSIINNPKIIIADEPTSNLDPENANIIFEFFKQAQKNGISIIISTHDMETLKYSDKTYVMNQGKLHCK